jgi:adenylosuccinate synthase
LNGVPPKAIRDVWGVAKIYETYVGAKDFEGPYEEFELIRELGEEYGATTGRTRQINWLDFDLLKMASRMNGTNKIVFNKMDILDKVEKWCAYDGPHILNFDSRNDMEFWLTTKLQILVDEDIETFFSGDKEYI